MEKEIVRASFGVEKEILDEFRKVVVQKYGHLWGVLHIEFEKALKNRLKELKEELSKENSQN
ncbi:MAG: hypothetical protein QXZ27_00325 [Candidatus Bathyarchaeia archaeon]